MSMRLLEQYQIPHTQSMVAKRGRTNRANVGRIPLDPAILAAIGHSFIAKKKTKNADAWV